MDQFRIHGDNIVECERIANIIIKAISPTNITTRLLSPSTLVVHLQACFLSNLVDWELTLLPGFNKNTKKRWSENIFDSLTEAGSYFDETPDAIISKVDDNNQESILLGIEFCSALQAGNQAWQRSARAFSTGRTGCPYIYIVDFVKYELDNATRARKNLRFPNAAVPYSYVSFSKSSANFVAQLYTKSEEFDRSKDLIIKDFDENNFGTEELGNYLVKLLLGLNTSVEEERILSKNRNVVHFIADKSDTATNFTANEWKEIYSLTDSKDIVEYSVEKNRFSFHKTIAEKSQHGSTKKFVNLIDQLSVGFASKDLPFGIIPSHSRKEFADEFSKIYKNTPKDILDEIAKDNKHLIVAIFKGFKPRGDDNRPDRGLLPLAAMLSTSDTDVLTYIYGPLIEANLNLLDSNPIVLAKKNGLWRSILALTNYLVLDVPVIASKDYDTTRILNTTKIKESYSKIGNGNKIVSKPAFDAIPINYGEDDVDTGIHYLFAHVLSSCCFEGMCNPPGGDWSGFSVVLNDYEYRWLSLPRESSVVDGKRPDHILELFGVFDKPLLLSVESKDKSISLEKDVGIKLIAYIENLMSYIPSAQRKLSSPTWQWGENTIDFSSFETISAAAYLKRYAQPSNIVFDKKCEMLFVMEPIFTSKMVGWEIEIITSSKRSEKVKEFIIQKCNVAGNTHFLIK